MSTASDVPEASGALDNGEPSTSGPEQRHALGGKKYTRLELPTPEQMAGQEAMNNCAVRTVLSAVMGAGLGAMFGLFMGTMDGAVSGSFGCRISRAHRVADWSWWT